jgi:hypothetical protein
MKATRNPEFLWWSLQKGKTKTSRNIDEDVTNIMYIEVAMDNHGTNQKR